MTFFVKVIQQKRKGGEKKVDFRRIKKRTKPQFAVA